MSFDLFRGKRFYKGPLAGDLYAALKLEIQRCVDQNIIPNVENINEDSYNAGYQGGAVFFQVTYKPIIPQKEGEWGFRQICTLRLEWSIDNKVSVQLMWKNIDSRSLSYQTFPIGDERVQRNLNGSFRHWISYGGNQRSDILREKSLDSYLDSLSHRHTDSPFLYMPSSLQWPNRVQGTTSSQFQTNYLSPSSFINPYSSYYSYR